MGRRGMGTVVAGLQTLFSVGTTAPLSDGQLLERFLKGGDETAQAAFACLVERHGPMVMRVCRGVLHDGHAAEDAFQVTFLVLARKAGSIKKHDSIASWLFGVARRVARKALAQDSRRATLEAEKAGLAHEPNPGASEPVVFHAEIHQEVDRLPDRYRAPVVLCYFEGLTQEQAATRLAVPTGTIKARLSRARERLKKRLVRRGLAPSVFMTYACDIVHTALPRSLVEKTALAAFQVWLGRSAGLSVSASALLEGMMRAMLITQLKTVVAAAATVMIASGLIATSLAVPARLASDPLQPPPRAQEPKKAPASEPQPKPDVPNTLTLKKGIVTRTTRQEGTLRAFESVNVAPRHSGFLKTLAVDIGAKVKKGQMLAEVQDDDLEIAVARTKALVQQALTRVAKAESGRQVALAAVAAAKAKLEVHGSKIKELEAMVTLCTKQQDHGRDLLGKQLVGDQVFDEINQRLKSATARLNSARSEVKVSQAELEEIRAKSEVSRSAQLEAQGDVKLAKIDLMKANSDIQSMTLTAPFDGIVTQRGHHVGEYLQGAGLERGEPLLTIKKTDRMRFVVQVPQQDAGILRVGDPATIRFDGRPGRYQGKVGFIPESLDGDHNLGAEIVLDNADGRLRDGQRGTAEITLQAPPDTIVIPKSALRVYDPQIHQGYCNRLVDGRNVQTRVRVFEFDEERLLVDEGLKEGDVIFKVSPPGTQ